MNSPIPVIIFFVFVLCNYIETTYGQRIKEWLIYHRFIKGD